MPGRSRIIKGKGPLRPVVTPYERETLEHQPAPARESYTEAPDTTAILTQAEEEAARIREEAREQGYAEGRAAARREFEDNLDQSAGALRRSIAEIENAHERFLALLEPQIVDLAYRIARRVLGREARTDRELVVEMARRALTLMTDRARVTIRMHPDDLQAIRNSRAALIESFDGIEHIDLIPDPKVAVGGCLVESETLVVDAGMNAQLNRILDELQE